MNLTNIILVKNNLVPVTGESSKKRGSVALVGTVLSNLSYYGFAPSHEVYSKLIKLTDESLKAWWSNIEPVLKNVTGDDKNMDKFVVYKNFPKEVLDMDQATYWTKQILMYIGFPDDLFTQEEKDREMMVENLTLKVLHLAKKDSLSKILNGLLMLPAKWTSSQLSHVRHLIFKEDISGDVSKIPFKENMVLLVSELIKNGNTNVNIKSATDVLRIAVGLSDGDFTLKTNSKFRTFSRPERRFFLKLLESSTSLTDDMARRKGQWKKFMKALHPNDYKSSFPSVCNAYDKLYNNKVKTFNSHVEELYSALDDGVLDLLATRPGEFMRRLHTMVWVFDRKAVNAFTDPKVLAKLSTFQLLKISKYIENINVHQYRMFPPKGNWTKVKIQDHKSGVSEKNQKILLKRINAEIANRVSSKFDSVNLDNSAKMIHLQTNDSDLLPYGRGTEFPIPENIKFIRSASYWQTTGYAYNTWFDNGWNFFDKNWTPLGACCWSAIKFNSTNKQLAVFSGDPTNSKTMDGKACQMIDLYLDKLQESNVRYAVWNILAYSHIPFSKAGEVFAAMQWGEEPQKGKLFEPSRCQLSFPLTGNNLTKYIAYVDVLERKVVYMDANFNGDVHSAVSNQTVLAEKMPAFVEYLENIPTVHDLFKGVKQSKTGLPVTYSDSELEIKSGDAYVFQPQKAENKFNQLDITTLL